ncbi:diacylglycerol kinase [Vibrio kanaloae]|uniref:diacylglycerol kinase n=1 Tax=Vibrio kanaloae TaxID=170673 RepID=UPI00355223EF
MYEIDKRGCGFKPIRNIRIALRGIYLAVLMDFSVAYKLALSIILMIGLFCFRQWLDFSLVFIVTVLVLVSEMFNTAIEALYDTFEPSQNSNIGRIKDVSAGWLVSEVAGLKFGS